MASLHAAMTSRAIACRAPVSVRRCPGRCRKPDPALLMRLGLLYNTRNLCDAWDDRSDEQELAR